MKKTVVLLMVVALVFGGGIAQAQEPQTEGNSSFALGVSSLDLDDLNKYLTDAGMPTFGSGILTMKFSSEMDLGINDWYFGNSTVVAYGEKKAKDDNAAFLSFGFVGIDGIKKYQLSQKTDVSIGSGAGLGILSLYLKHSDPVDFENLVGTAHDSNLVKYYFMLKPEAELTYKVNKYSSLNLSLDYHYGISGDKWSHYYSNKVAGPLSTLTGSSVTAGFNINY